MADITRNFTAGKMNKLVDERLVPDGEYIDALNIRMGSTELSEVGVIENTKGNIALTALTYTDGTPLSVDAVCIGSIADSAHETIYWFVHDPNFPVGATGKLDLIVSFNVFTNILTYHVISIDDGNGADTTLNFNPKYLITGVNIIENLLFFTDNLNQPRFINIKDNYANPVANIDQFSAESILVIKKPPTEAPSIQPFVTGGQQNYMTERFICFAYRYKYANGEYSATSQWSAPAFIPNPFDLSVSSVLNEGMVNFCNACIVTYNSGGPLVVGIDLLFKQSSGGIIKVIDNLNKSDLGLSDNTDYTYTFSNSKIFTVLPEAEILRLYDNVPRLAQAQTIMGNRLMYGNYVEGYNMVDNDGQPVKLDYTTSLVSEEVGITNIPDTTSAGNYSIDGAVVVADSVLNLDLTDANLVAGSALSFDVTLTHAQFSGSVSPTEQTANFTVSFAFFLAQDYASVYDMVNSIEFQNAIGTNLNTKPVYPTFLSCDGTTFTDNINCVTPMTLDTYTKYDYGITSLVKHVEATATAGSPILKVQFAATKYADTASPTNYAFEYYSIIASEATFQEIASPKSLHSNRDYEIGIVYMDEFNRSSTALVSLNNTEHISCSLSSYKNSIQVTIPTSQIAPYWAKRYKFVIKPDKENYETIYSNLFFKDPASNNVYFYLEGENARKVEQGDRLIVKTDSDGPTFSCSYATVLEKEVKQEGFITPVVNATPPAGVYMKIIPSEFSVVENENAIIAPGTIQTDENTSGDYVLQYYPMNIEDPNVPGMYIDYTIPAGSRIKMYIKFQRKGTGGGDKLCEKRIYILDLVLTSSSNYDNIYDWWIGDNVTGVLNSGVSDVGAGECPIVNQFLPGITNTLGDIPQDTCTNYFKFYRDLSNQRLYLMLRGTVRCAGVFSPPKRRSSIITNIEVYRAENTFVFETEPSDALPDIFYENELSFEIDSNGQHMGNIQDQNFGLNQPAIVDTGFFNCFSFGNGVESYKIRDSIVGRPLTLGNRVTAVSAQDYKEAHRFSDITYSGIYNTESNLNKLNEFNSGLLNYKYLEVSFGPIYKMDGRETDVLVLQEDKISYVLAGKNLLSDAAAGGAVTSVPEVLGTQIARTENYGISFNPESYVQWGYDRYFTDAKRGAVIQLVGNSYSNEQIKVISEQGMRTWFRDVFNASFNTQKLGGFDPYMNEYVLCTTDRELPVDDQCLDCGVSQVFTLNSGGSKIEYCVDLGPLVGDSTLTWNVISIEDGAEFHFDITYNGTTYNTTPTDISGSFVFPKEFNYDEIAYIGITYTGSVVLDVTVGCPDPQEMTIVQIVLTRDADSGKTIHAEYNYANGPYTSPTQSNLVLFASGTANPLVSAYNMFTGYAGAGGFPPDGSTMRIQTNKIGFDTYDFDSTSNKLRYYRSSTLYTNTPANMSSLLALSTDATPILGGPNTYYADFSVPPSTSGQYVYLIYDLRSSTAQQLCYHPNSVDEVCCNCAECLPEDCVTYEITAPAGGGDVEILFNNGLCGEVTPYTLNVLEGDTVQLCVNNKTYTIVSGSPIIQALSCDCTPCEESCWTFTIDNIIGGSVTIAYADCFSGRQLKQFFGPVRICTPIGMPPFIFDGFCNITLTGDCGCCADSTCYTWYFENNSETESASINYIDCEGSPSIVNLIGGASFAVCGTPLYPEVISGSVSITFQCDCII